MCQQSPPIIKDLESVKRDPICVKRDLVYVKNDLVRDTCRSSTPLIMYVCMYTEREREKERERQTHT